MVKNGICPYFSVVIPTYNRAQFLKIALDSVLNQTWTDFELIVVDDGSTDNTRQLIDGLSQPRLRYLCQKHQGVSAARNKGLKQAQGKFICFLDSDDRWRQDKLEVTQQYIQDNPQYQIFHSEEIWYRAGSYLAAKKYHSKPQGWVFNQAVTLCCISISTAAIHKDIFGHIGLFDEELPACEDYDFWLRATARFPVFLIPQELTIKQGGHPDQQSKAYEGLDKFRIQALAKIIGSGTLSGEQRQAAKLELKNKCAIYIKGARKRGKSQEVKHYQALLSKL